MTFSRPKDSLLTGINQLRTTEATEFLERNTYVEKDQHNHAAVKYF